VLCVKWKWPSRTAEGVALYLSCPYLPRKTQKAAYSLWSKHKVLCSGSRPFGIAQCAAAIVVCLSPFVIYLYYGVS